jgi:hypothetical protein
VKRGSQNKSGDRLTPRPERKESQLFEEILWLSPQLFRESNSTYTDAPAAYLWEWAVE